MTSNSTTYDRTVDAVDDLGWDPEGNRPVTDSLQSILQDGTLVELPPGEYLVDGRVDATGLENWGIRGTGDEKGDARFVVPPGKAQRIFNIRGDSRNIRVENLTFDQYDTWETCIGNVLQVADGLVVRDVEYAGKNPSEDTGATSHLNLYVLDPDGSALLDGLVFKGATELIDYPENVLTIFSGAESKGTINIRNCHFENCGEHAIYASRCESSVRIENCYFKNNQNAHVRISGDDSWVKNSTFVWDVENHPNRGEFQAQTGMTFEAGFQGFAGGLVDSCVFICRSSAPNSGCLKVDGSHGGLTVRDSTFKVDAEGAEPIWADAPGDSHMIDGEPAKPWDVQLENVHVTGSGAGSHDHEAAVEIQGRSGSALRNSCIDVDVRDGIRVTDGEYHVESSAIAVPSGRAQIRTSSAQVTRDGLTGDASCRLPGDSTETTDESDETMESYAHQLQVIGTDGVSHYEIDVSGAAGIVTTGDYAATEGYDTVTQHDDGTATLAGVVAGGGGDTFEFDGEIVDVRITDGPDPVVEVDGEVVDLALFREDGLNDTEREEARGIAAEEAQAARRTDEEILELAEQKHVSLTEKVVEYLRR